MRFPPLVAATMMVVVVAPFMLAYAGQSKVGGASREQVITPDMVVSPQNLRGLEHLAAKGSAAAASNLFAYYAFLHRPHTLEDDVIARQWLKRAAENGDPESMLEYATVIQNEGGSMNCRAAIAWARKALQATRDNRTIGRANEILLSFKKMPDCSGLI